MKQFQTNYSDLQRENRACIASRRQKGLKTISIIRDYAKTDLSSKRVLEIGCFLGDISLDLAVHFGEYHAIDIDQSALRKIPGKKGDSAARFYAMSADALSFKDGSIDIVICSHIYEHVPDPQKMMDAIFRVLKPGGFCYFAAANRIQIIDSEYGLPFATLLPKMIANWYVRWLRNIPEYYETFYFYPSLAKLSRRFTRFDYTIKVIEHPDRFEALDMIKPGALLQKVCLILIKFFYWISPAYIWILQKPASEKPR
jgi:ubiquinone/menaquinone biosynthesis C-methylase UbiE